MRGGKCENPSSYVMTTGAPPTVSFRLPPFMSFRPERSGVEESWHYPAWNKLRKIPPFRLRSSRDDTVGDATLGMTCGEGSAKIPPLCHDHRSEAEWRNPGTAPHGTSCGRSLHSAYAPVGMTGFGDAPVGMTGFGDAPVGMTGFGDAAFGMTRVAVLRSG